MKMYFATTANGRSETKSVWDTIMEPILVMYIYGRANATTVYCGTFCTQSILHRVQLQKSLPTMTSKSVFEEVSKSSTDQLCCSSKVGEIRDIESYQFKPEMDKIQAKIAKPKDQGSRVRH